MSRELLIAAGYHDSDVDEGVEWAHAHGYLWRTEDERDQIALTWILLGAERVLQGERIPWEPNQCL
jgi:hypothetical protein